MMSFKPLNVAMATCLSVGFVSACSAPPVVIDETPFIKTATITTSIRNNGYKGFLANDAEQVIRTAANMRRTDDRYSFTGTVMSRIGGKNDTSEIIRLDKNLEWQLDNRKKRYTECELGGCGNLNKFSLDTYAEQIGATPSESEEGEDYPEDSCQVSVTQNDFSIKRTGEQREVNGFPATEYVMQWLIAVTDDTGASATNQLTSTTWTTPITGTVAEALQMNAAFDAAYDSALTSSFPSQFGDVLPEDAVAVIERYLLESLGDEQLNLLKSMISNQVEVTGYPVSQKVQWDMSGSTCAEPEEVAQKSESMLDTSSFGGLLKSVGKQVVGQEIGRRQEEKALEIKMAPVFSIVTEVKSIELGETRESKLLVPANYKLRNRS